MVGSAAQSRPGCEAKTDLICTSIYLWYFGPGTHTIRSPGRQPGGSNAVYTITPPPAPGAADAVRVFGT
eukprot:SAG31_NODE_9722_length_1237_cov_1.175747_1_plen_68_part_10